LRNLPTSLIHEPRESNPEHGVCADDLEWLFRDYDVSVVEMKTPWELEGKTREEWETQFDPEPITESR